MPDLARPDNEPNPPPIPPSPAPPVGTPWGAIGPLPHREPTPADLQATVIELFEAKAVVEVPAIVREQPMSCTVGATASPTLLIVSILGVGALLRRARRKRLRQPIM